MLLQLFKNISGREKTEAIKNLFERSVPSQDFFLMIVLSVLMSTFGLLIDSPAVVVGSMLIAPILYPILGLAMGIVMSDLVLVSKSFLTLVKAVVLGIIISAGVTTLFSSQANGLTGSIMMLTRPSLLYASIGAIAGFAAAFAMVKPKLNEMLPGVSISVALIPPLAVVGIGIARFNSTVLLGSLLLFLTNAIGVIVTSVVVFALMNFYVKRETAKAVVKKEEKKLEKEKQQNTDNPGK